MSDARVDSLRDAGENPGMGAAIDATNVPGVKSEKKLERRGSMRGNSFATGSAPVAPQVNTPEFDEHCLREFYEIKEWLKDLTAKNGQSDLLSQQAQKTAAEHAQGLNDLGQHLSYLGQRLDSLVSEIEQATANGARLNNRLEQVAEQAGASALLSADVLEAAKEALMYAIAKVRHANNTALRARPEDKTQADSDLKEAREVLAGKTMEFLKLKAQQKFDDLPKNLPMVKIEKLQQQLAESIRKNRNNAPVAGWSWRTMFSTDKNARALASVERLANNAAFSKLDARTDEQLAVNAELIELMMFATYALTNFGKMIAASTPVLQVVPEDEDSSADEAEGDRNSLNINRKATTPQRLSAVKAAAAAGSFSQSGVRSSAKKISTPLAHEDSEAALEAQVENTINQAVIDVIRQKLAAIQKREDGLIGKESESRQFWGNVLMTLALAITVTLAAVALMSALGATPAFLVPYFAAVQATQIISTVLNFVAAKLTLDLNAAAAVTVAATAGAFGVFGKGLHMSGAPTSLKRDLNKAAQDLEAALKDTEAARSTAPALR